MLSSLFAGLGRKKGGRRGVSFRCGLGGEGKRRGDVAQRLGLGGQWAAAGSLRSHCFPGGVGRLANGSGSVVLWVLVAVTTPSVSKLPVPRMFLAAR